MSSIANNGIWNSIIDYSGENLTPPNNIRTTSRYAIWILDGNVWKFKLKDAKSKINFPLQNADEINENWYEYSDCDFNNKETYDQLIFNQYTDALYQEIKLDYVRRTELELNQDLIKWKIKFDNEKIELKVFKQINEDLVCS